MEEGKTSLARRVERVEKEPCASRSALTSLFSNRPSLRPYLPQPGISFSTLQAQHGNNWEGGMQISWNGGLGARSACGRTLLMLALPTDSFRLTPDSQPRCPIVQSQGYTTTRKAYPYQSCLVWSGLVWSSGSARILVLKTDSSSGLYVQGPKSKVQGSASSA